MEDGERFAKIVEVELISHANSEADLSPLTRFDTGFTTWHRYTVSAQFYMRNSCTVDLDSFSTSKKKKAVAANECTVEQSTGEFGNTDSSFGEKL